MIDLTLSDDDDFATPNVAAPMSSPVIIPSRQSRAPSAPVTQTAPSAPVSQAAPSAPVTQPTRSQPAQQVQSAPPPIALPQAATAPPPVALPQTRTVPAPPPTATATPTVALPQSTIAPPPVSLPRPVIRAPPVALPRSAPISITLTLPSVPPAVPTVRTPVSTPSNKPPRTTPQPLSASFVTAAEMQDAQEAQEALVREMEQSLAEFPSGSSAIQSSTGRERAGSDASMGRNPSVVDPGRARSLSDVPASRPISQLCPVPDPECDDGEDDMIPSPTPSTLEAMEQAAAAAESLLADKRFDADSVELTPSPRDGSSEPDPITGFSVPQPPFPTAFVNKSGPPLSVRADLDPQRGLVTSTVNSMREKSRSEIQQRRHSSETGQRHSNGEIRSTNGTVRAWIGSPFPTDSSLRQSPQFPHGR